MPPTRRSSGFLNNGLEAGGHDGPNIEQFLELLEQFKRKHVVQNREIIKTNAMQAIRIRDLEQRIQQLEGDRCSEQMEICSLQRQLDETIRLKDDHARNMWWEMGKQMGFLQPRDPSSSSSNRQSNGLLLHQLLTDSQYPQLSASTLPAHLQPSPHVKIDPHALPGGVARSIARPPPLGIDRIGEDGEDDMQQQDHDLTNDRISSAANNLFSIPPAHPSSSSSSSLPSSSRVTKRNVIPTKRRVEAPSSIMDAEPIPPSTPSSSDRQQQPDPPASFDLQRPPSSPSPPTNHQDEEMLELIPDIPDVPDVEEGGAEAGALRLTNLTLQSPPSTNSSADQSPTVASPAVSRKRKTTSPTPPAKPRDRTPANQAQGSQSHSFLSSSSPNNLSEDVYDEQQQQEQEDDQDDMELEQSGSIATRSSRRSSVRARASVNYALPKLNTKMRKPDPEDLKPAKVSRSRSSASRANGSSNGGGGSHVRSTSANGDLNELKRVRERSISVEPQRTANERGGDEHEAKQVAMHPTPTGGSLSELFHSDDGQSRDNFRTHRGEALECESRDTTDDERETSESEMERDDDEIDGIQAADEQEEEDDGDETARDPNAGRSRGSSQVSSIATGGGARRPSQNRVNGHAFSSEAASSTSSSSSSSATPRASKASLPRTSSSRLTDSTAASRSRSVSTGNDSSSGRRASRPSSSKKPSTSDSSASSSPALLTALGLPSTHFDFTPQSQHQNFTPSTPAPQSSTAKARKVSALRKLNTNGNNTTTTATTNGGPGGVAKRMQLKKVRSMPTSMGSANGTTSIGENVDPATR
ncbi:unnamed protein product [Sympodiomycopsis kandeliae]